MLFLKNKNTKIKSQKVYADDKIDNSKHFSEKKTENKDNNLILKKTPSDNSSILNIDSLTHFVQEDSKKIITLKETREDNIKEMESKIYIIINDNQTDSDTNQKKNYTHDNSKKLNKIQKKKIKKHNTNKVFSDDELFVCNYRYLRSQNNNIKKYQIKTRNKTLKAR